MASACVVLALAGACGSEGSDSVTPAQSGGEPATTVADSSPVTQPGGAKAAPRWETVSTFSGTGAFQTPEFSILANAIQWRVRYHCDTGSLRITTTPPPRRGGALAETTCPKDGEGFSIVTGSVRMGIETTGPWRAIVDQQVDTALDEPAPAGLATARVLSQGAFYDVEKTGKGTARISQLADGRRVLRFEGFEVPENTDLFVWLTEAASPKTTVEAVNARRYELGNLKSTLGNQNYDVPADVSLNRVKSVVIWCDPVRIAYAAAPLES